jgi:hypothetical protein
MSTSLRLHATSRRQSKGRGDNMWLCLRRQGGLVDKEETILDEVHNSR